MNPQDFTILNIDDDDAGRYAKTRILQRAGYRVVDAGTGMDTFKIARREKPQLILLDVMLPDINGLEVCRLLKSDPETAHIMILQVSATHVTEADRVQGLEGGADGDRRSRWKPKSCRQPSKPCCAFTAAKRKIASC